MKCCRADELENQFYHYKRENNTLYLSSILLCPITEFNVSYKSEEWCIHYVQNLAKHYSIEERLKKYCTSWLIEIGEREVKKHKGCNLSEFILKDGKVIFIDEVPIVKNSFEKWWDEFIIPDLECKQNANSNKKQKSSTKKKETPTTSKPKKVLDLKVGDTALIKKKSRPYMVCYVLSITPKAKRINVTYKGSLQFKITFNCYGEPIGMYSKSDYSLHEMNDKLKKKLESKYNTEQSSQ